MALALVTDIGVIVLILAGIVLCIVVIALVARLTPPLLRSARHLEKVSNDTAAVSEDVANDIAKTARNAAIASESAIATLGHLEKISNDTAAVSEAVANDIAKTARNVAIASENAIATLENLNKISGDAAAVSEDVTNDVAKRVCDNQMPAFCPTWLAVMRHLDSCFRRNDEVGRKPLSHIL